MSEEENTSKAKILLCMFKGRYEVDPFFNIIDDFLKLNNPKLFPSF